MAKVSIKNYSKLFNSIDKVFDRTLKSDSMYQKITKFVTTRIVQQTRAGNDLSRDNKSGKQPPLSEGYIEYRKRLKSGEIKDRKVKPAGSNFRPAFSNLTLTGQLLKSVKGVFSKTQRTIIIEPTGTRKDGLTNKEVTKDLAERGRTFLGLDKIGELRIRRIVLDILRRNIRNFNK